ncbi:MAG TPA: hypothetical protein PKL69_01810 [Agitococcus sp.]|jgi:hypothetical protein|nr:hypothetical protein [Agitococcus sp.]HMY00466.1 hypothetical protein [Agitococcus sp.]HNJ86103.1 hypothetical protein [Agitococcus sp.]HNL79071.1 hypothetical protein [Agitococcus sp.]
MDILERQSRLIETQRTLFINTVKQFEKDLTYLRGTLASIWASFDSDEPSRRSLEFSLRHIDEMHSMLNDFDLRMSQNERN